MRWEFKQEPADAQRWRWQCVDDETGSVLRMSESLFADFAECVRDAQNNGYDAAQQPA